MVIILARFVWLAKIRYVMTLVNIIKHMFWEILQYFRTELASKTWAALKTQFTFLIIYRYNYIVRLFIVIFDTSNQHFRIDLPKNVRVTSQG